MVELVPHIWFPWKEEVFHELKSRQNIDYSMTQQRFLRENFCRAVELVGALAQQWDQETETENAENHYSAVYGVVLDNRPWAAYAEVPQAQRHRPP